MERIGVFGGLFNPPHVGHIKGALQAKSALKLDRLLLVPALHANQESDPAMEQRLHLLELAAESAPELEICRMELEDPAVTCTADTLRRLKQENPDAELFLIMGSDMFSAFLEGKDPEKIIRLATLAVLHRGTKGEEKAIQAQAEILTGMGAKVALIENQTILISSTQMRRLLAFQCAADLLPEGLWEYIRNNGLYNTSARWKNLPMDELEQVVISLLNPNRVAHVLGCRDTAVELARHWGADVVDAARAGILHDVTKALDGPLQLTLCEAYGKILSDFSRKYPRTLHAVTGAFVAERIFGENEAVVCAIRHHTTGRANMSLLEKIIYVADYMEPNRDFPGVEKLRHLAFTDITAALKLGLEMTLEHLNEQGNEVSPESQEALSYLENYAPSL